MGELVGRGSRSRHLDRDYRHGLVRRFFRTLANIALKDDASALGNPLLAEQLINGHVATQVLAIRRLMDNSRNIISLRRLIIEIRRNWWLFTREIYVCFDGLPYNYETAMQREMAAHAGKAFFWCATTGPDGWGMSERAHHQFDKLAGIEPSKRSREDRLPLTLLDKIEGWLVSSGADQLAKWSHAYLAHAGSAESRELIADAIVTNDKITAAMKVLARTTEAISAYLLFSSGRLNSLMATAQFDQFKNLDRSVMQPGRQEEVRAIWDRLGDERDRFLEGVAEELAVQIRPNEEASLYGPMSALGQKRTCAVQNGMSTLPPKADIGARKQMSARDQLPESVGCCCYCGRA